MEARTGIVRSYNVEEVLDTEILEVRELDPKHSETPKSFVLSANGQRYKNTTVQRRKARKAQKESRKKHRR